VVVCRICKKRAGHRPSPRKDGTTRTGFGTAALKKSGAVRSGSAPAIVSRRAPHRVCCESLKPAPAPPSCSASAKGRSAASEQPAGRGGNVFSQRRSPQAAFKDEPILFVDFCSWHPKKFARLHRLAHYRNILEICRIHRSSGSAGLSAREAEALCTELATGKN